MHQEEAK